MKKNNDNDKNLIDLQPGGQKTPGEFESQSHIVFAQRVALADDKTRSRYNAVKNAFMGYSAPDKGLHVTCTVDVYGEAFYLGAALLGKIRLVRGYVRLFLALKPSKYPKARYQHNDYSRISRYADCPLEINICNAERVKSAYSLIGEVMRRAGAAPDKAHLARDWSAEHESSLSAKIDAFSYADMAAADAAIADNDISEDQPDPPAEHIPAGPFYGKSAAGGGPVAARGGGTDGGEASGPYKGYEYGGFYVPAPARLPGRAKVLDADGKKIGKVRKNVWYDLEGKTQGEFWKEEENVYLYENGRRKGFLDSNDNVIAMSNDYMATLKRFPAAILALLFIILMMLTALSGVISAYCIELSKDNYAPELFVYNDVDDWSQSRNLSVFYNERFGTEKVAPGMTGSYAFTLSNENPDALDFSLEFSCINEYGIDMAYSLWRDGVCLKGAESKLSAEELSTYGMTIEAESDSVFVLEWEWRHNDAADTEAGINEATYTLNIKFTAAVRDL